MPRHDPFAFMKEAAVKIEKDVCCGSKMVIQGSYLLCKICNTLHQYIPEMFEKPESQRTKCDSEGNMHYGKVTEKTPKERVAAIIDEFGLNKIPAHWETKLDDHTIYEASLLMYQITKIRTKKKDNRDQLFAGCLDYAARKRGFVIPSRDLVKMLNLDKDGIGQGVGEISKFSIMNGIDIVLDTPLYPHYVRKYLQNASLMPRNLFKNPDIDNEENVNFCIELVEFMLNNSINYDTKITTKCSASVFYLLNRNDGNYQSDWKSLAKTIGVGQNTTVYALNTINSIECQAILPAHLRNSTYLIIKKTRRSKNIS